MDIEPVDLRDELGERIQLGLELAPVVIGGPVVDELLYLGQLRAWVRSLTVSRSGQRGTATRRRSSWSDSSGMSIRKGRMPSFEDMWVSFCAR